MKYWIGFRSRDGRICAVRQGTDAVPTSAREGKETVLVFADRYEEALRKVKEEFDARDQAGDS